MANTQVTQQENERHVLLVVQRLNIRNAFKRSGHVKPTIFVIRSAVVADPSTAKSVRRMGARRGRHVPTVHPIWLEESAVVMGSVERMPEFLPKIADLDPEGSLTEPDIRNIVRVAGVKCELVLVDNPDCVDESGVRLVGRAACWPRRLSCEFTLNNEVRRCQFRPAARTTRVPTSNSVFRRTVAGGIVKYDLCLLMTGASKVLRVERNGARDYVKIIRLAKHPELVKVRGESLFRHGPWPLGRFTQMCHACWGIILNRWIG
jgi:hypothetical protein